MLVSMIAELNSIGDRIKTSHTTSFTRGDMCSVVALQNLIDRSLWDDQASLRRIEMLGSHSQSNKVARVGSLSNFAKGYIRHMFTLFAEYNRALLREAQAAMLLCVVNGLGVCVEPNKVAHIGSHAMLHFAV